MTDLKVIPEFDVIASTAMITITYWTETYELCDFKRHAPLTVHLLLLPALHMVKLELRCLLSETRRHIEVSLFTNLFDYKYFASLFKVSLAWAHQSPWMAGLRWLDSPTSGFCSRLQVNPALLCLSKHKQTHLIFPSYTNITSGGIFHDHRGKSSHYPVKSVKTYLSCQP